MSFEVDISKWAAKSSRQMGDLHRAVCLKLFNRVIMATPVGNPDNWKSLWKWDDGTAVNPPEGYVGGRLRGNWQISSDTPASGTVEIIDPEGTKTTAKVEHFILSKDFKKDIEIYLTNNLPYAYTVEYDGHSGQAPEGMVRNNLIRITNNLKSQA